jgi:hypothetical protein
MYPWNQVLKIWIVLKTFQGLKAILFRVNHPMECRHNKDKVCQVQEAQVVREAQVAKEAREWDPQVEDKDNIEDLPLKDNHQVWTLIKGSQLLIQEIYLEETL